MFKKTLVGILLVILAVILYVSYSSTQEGFQTSRRVVVSLSTSPKRIHHLERTLTSLTDIQLQKPDLIYLNLPERFGRTGEPYTIPDFLKKYPLVKINRVPVDEGPITKLTPAVRAETDPTTYIIIVDDDIEYAPDLIRKLVREADKNPGAVISNWCDKSKYVKSNLPEPFCEIPEGYGGVLFPRSVFRGDFDTYVATVTANKNPCYTADDFTIGNYLAKHKVPRRNLHGEFPTNLGHGLEADGLRVIDGNSADRYDRCKEYMRAQNLVYMPF
jgi:hypothetical protein